MSLFDYYFQTHPFLVGLVTCINFSLVVGVLLEITRTYLFLFDKMEEYKYKKLMIIPLVEHRNKWLKWTLTILIASSIGTMYFFLRTTSGFFGIAIIFVVCLLCSLSIVVAGLVNHYFQIELNSKKEFTIYFTFLLLLCLCVLYGNYFFIYVKHANLLLR